jgi:hypothetical protein
MPDRPIERWRDRAPGRTAPEDAAAERFREVRVPAVTDVQLARVARRITSAIDAPGPRPRPRLQWMALAILLGTAFTAGAAVVGVRIARHARLVRAHRMVAPAPDSTHPSRQTTPEESPEEPDEPQVAEPEAMPETPEPSALSSPQQRSPHKPDEPSVGLTAEARLLHAALEDLNVHGDPASALARLDAYRTRYPRGVLAREAEVARVDALLRLGRDSEALALLDRSSETGFSGYPRSVHLRVLRGELLAKAGRCGEAVPIFSGALSDPQAGQSAERALFGRASCRAALGEPSASREDLTRYLELYPNGSFAAEARRALTR